MDTCEVLIVGGGPAGSACAWRLRRAGIEVAIIDRARFPRDKVCAGWITPQVIDDLQIDVGDYRAGRTLQPVTAFRVGVIGCSDATEAHYDGPVSYGIRRCEFDQYLLQRSGARLLPGAPVSTIRRAGSGWIVNETIRASMLVGAGGHFCPVGRLLNASCSRDALVAAQEVEFPIAPEDLVGCPIDADRPELYFCHDFAGYGWCFRKQNYLNVGFGRLNARSLPRDTADFVAFLTAKRQLPLSAAPRWRGHAYLVAGSSRRRLVGDAVMLIGDAAGLAYAESGEGIRPAIESGLLAASAIIDSGGHYDHGRLAPYVDRVQRRFGLRSIGGSISRLVPSAAARAVARRMLASSWFVRHVVIDRWFLHAREPALAST
jgi:flavin-dependent dehydrogenase